MTSRQDSGSAKRSQNETFEVQDFILNYDSPLEEFDEESHCKQYSSPRVMKSDSQIKDKGKHHVKEDLKKESPPDWVLTLISSVKRLEQKIDITSNEVELLKKDTTKEQEIKRKKMGMKKMLNLFHELRY